MFSHQMMMDSCLPWVYSHAFSILNLTHLYSIQVYNTSYPLQSVTSLIHARLLLLLLLSMPVTSGGNARDLKLLL